MKTKGSLLRKISPSRTQATSAIHARLLILLVRGTGVLIVLIITCAGSVMLLINIVTTILYLRSLLTMISNHVDGKTKKKKKN